MFYDFYSSPNLDPNPPSPHSMVTTLFIVIEMAPWRGAETITTVASLLDSNNKCIHIIWNTFVSQYIMVQYCIYYWNGYAGIVSTVNSLI